MRKFTKICLIISILCVCLAALCIGAGIAMGCGIEDIQHMADNGELNIGNWEIGNFQFQWNARKGNHDSAEFRKGSMKESFPEAEVKSLKIDVKYGEVKFIDSDTDEVEITIDAPKSNAYRCENQQGVLKLEDRTKVFQWKFRKNKNSQVKITVAIPKDKEFKEVKLTTNAGSMDIDHVFFAGDMELELNAGELVAEKLNVQKAFSVEVGAGAATVEDYEAEALEVNCGVGEARLKGKVKEQAEVECGVGEIHMVLFGKEEDYDYEISCGVGEVAINDTSYNSLSANKEINHQTGREISLNCGVGEINLITEEE